MVAELEHDGVDSAVVSAEFVVPGKSLTICAGKRRGEAQPSGLCGVLGGAGNVVSASFAPRGTVFFTWRELHSFDHPDGQNPSVVQI